MARQYEAGRYLLQGLSPRQIAKRMGISLSSVRQYLCSLLGEGLILHSDIAFNIEERRLIEDELISYAANEASARNIGGATLDNPYANAELAKTLEDALYKKTERYVPADLIELYLVARDPRPDLYELVCKIELLLRRFVKQVLEAAYGDRWWWEGIPAFTRKQCQNRREEDETSPDDPYCYTTFVDLKSIIEANWHLFSIALPKSFTANQPCTLQMLLCLNSIRNQVMYPIKQVSEYENSYQFARRFLADMDPLHWHIKDVPAISVAQNVAAVAV